MARVLVADGDRKSARFVGRSLRERGHSFNIAADGEEALAMALFTEFELMILETVLRKKNGLEVVAELRIQGNKTPILFLSNRVSVEDRVRGLDAGADDYLTKPFALEELHARSRALLRRGGALAREYLSFGTLELDRIKHSARAEGRPLDLSRKQYELLEYFALRPETDVRRTELLEKIWGLSFDPGTNLVDVHLSHLRRKLRDAGIEGVLRTIRGVGFRFEPPS